MIASTSTSIAWVILLISLAGWAFYAFSNIRSSRSEIGSEQKLAANRKPYYDDEVLEGLRIGSIDAFGGWAKVQADHFGDKGIFDQIYVPQ